MALDSDCGLSARPLRVQLFAQFAAQHLRESLTVKELECGITDPLEG